MAEVPVWIISALARMGERAHYKTPWCTPFINDVLVTCGYPENPNSLAKSYLNYGMLLTSPRLGCIVIFNRPPNIEEGHCSFYLTTIPLEPLYEYFIVCLGANQYNTVSIYLYPLHHVVGYIMPVKE